MRKKQKSFGVTLIELLVVVLVLAALCTVAIPRVSQSAKNAKQNACDTNIDMMNSAIEMYNADNGAYPTNLVDITGDAGSRSDYFPDGPPNCPFGGVYTLTSKMKVTCSH